LTLKEKCDSIKENSASDIDEIETYALLKIERNIFGGIILTICLYQQIKFGAAENHNIYRMFKEKIS
jgi:hypothetical protein